MNHWQFAVFILWVLLGPCYDLEATIYPIQFAIPENKIVDSIPEKTQDFGTVYPGKLETYVFEQESDYYKDYQRSYFAVTKIKGGWDCVRHYEILGCGCIPYFLDLDQCDLNTMYYLPRDLIKEAMNLPGVSYPIIDHRVFDKAKYFEILQKLLNHTRKYLTCKAIAQHLLDKVNYKGTGKILYLSGNMGPDGMREFTLIGLKEIYGNQVCDWPKVDFIYDTYRGNILREYGYLNRGFTFTKIIPDQWVDRNNIARRIRNKEFDLVIYAQFHRGRPFEDIVNAVYDPEEIAYICGEDLHVCHNEGRKNFFLREFQKGDRDLY